MNDQLKVAQEPAHDILRSERLPLDFISSAPPTGKEVSAAR
jgi:hypothetical protein